MIMTTSANVKFKLHLYFAMVELVINHIKEGWCSGNTLRLPERREFDSRS